MKTIYDFSQEAIDDARLNTIGIHQLVTYQPHKFVSHFDSSGTFAPDEIIVIHWLQLFGPATVS